MKSSSREKSDNRVEARSDAGGDRRWSFATSHARVLAHIARDPNARLREIAAGAGITERRAVQVIADLENEGYLQRTREGRRNHYALKGLPSLAPSQLQALMASPAIALLLDTFDRQPFA